LSARPQADPQASAGARRQALAGTRQRALARVNLAAIERNCARLRRALEAGCELCAVVKADGYGHGALPSARAALRGGATWLAVAGSREARRLRDAGLTDTRLLVMGALSEQELGEALGAGAEVVVWREDQVQAVAAAGGGRVHVKLDTGMGRLGTRDAERALAVLAAARDAPGVTPAGAMTHFATADDRADPFFARQLALFEAWVQDVRALCPQIVVHAANSAAALREPRSHFDMVRCGIAVYGMDPFGEDPYAQGLEPALSLSSYVAEVKLCEPGQSAGYGRRFVAKEATQLAVLPIGYGDGWRRALSNNSEVLIDGTRRRLVGTISMDNLTVDLGDTAPAQALRGAEAILIGGERKGELITAEEIARRLETINYEITCGLTARVPRVYHRDGEPAQAPLGQGAAEPPSRL
jgi:alanine racemase